MRLSFTTLLPIALSLASFASAYHDHTNEAREYVDDLSSRGFDDYTLERREVLEDIATRDLLDELEDRLARRGRFLCTVAGCNFVGNLPYDFPLSCQREGVRPGCTPRGQLWRIAATSSTEGIVEGRHGGMAALRHPSLSLSEVIRRIALSLDHHHRVSALPIANRLASEPQFRFSIRVCHGTFRPLSIRFSHDGRVNILEGADVPAIAISVTAPRRAGTLGPKGRNVIIEQSFCAHKVTEADVMVAKSITLKARFENLGVHLTRSPETTRYPLPSSSVSRPCHLLLGTLANGDTNVANLFAQATERVGKKGVGTVKEGRTIGDDRAIIEGMHLNLSGFMPSPVLRHRRQGANGLVREADIAPTRHLHRTGSRRPIPVLDGEGPGDAPKRSLVTPRSSGADSFTDELEVKPRRLQWSSLARKRCGESWVKRIHLLDANLVPPQTRIALSFQERLGKLTTGEERLEEEWGVIVGRLEDDSGVEGKVNWWYYAGVGESVDMVAVGGCRSLERSCRCAWGGEFVDYNWRGLEGPGGVK
ncbi:hypothetical protein DFP72DRAFT_1051569 [Ephemerocybe angulata]|uniref:Uncharacterized protein n=1 Tax=Ephemerocybe angulata TaxID=980116 RepID=A0A8H6HF12_9AGAR|nr:hypothetical protein DFP72DRAFT_1051569 [Tulosesus angulatus]